MILVPKKLITLDRAKKEVDRLQEYIYLVENYETNTLNKWIIKKYALTNSIKNIVEEADENGVTNDDDFPLDRKYVTDLINGKTMDELHRMLRLGYRQKIKPNKRRS